MILPFEHIRVFRRKGVIKPILIREPMGLLETLIEVYSDHMNKKRGELDEVVSDCEYLGYDFKLVRGVASILDSYSLFQSRSVLPPIDIRRQVFRLAAKKIVISNEDRLSVLSQIAEINDVSLADIEDGLYSDLESEQYMVEFRKPVSEDLALYYNYAHTVALLAYATRLEVSYRGSDDYLEKLLDSLGEEESSRGSSKIIHLKPTNRLSQRASKIDDFLSRLLNSEGWLLRAYVKYPARYKTTCLFEIDSRGDGRLLKTDPVEEEMMIDISYIQKKKKRLKYGEIIVLDEVAEREGVTNGTILRAIKEEGGEYKKLGGVLVVPSKYEEIKKSLDSMDTIGEAQSYFKSLGVRDFMQMIESFGYQIEWTKPRKSSKLYRL